jgi:hypothetical protein
MVIVYFLESKYLITISKDKSLWKWIKVIVGFGVACLVLNSAFAVFIGFWPDLDNIYLGHTDFISATLLLTHNVGTILFGVFLIRNVSKQKKSMNINFLPHLEAGSFTIILMTLSQILRCAINFGYLLKGGFLAAITEVNANTQLMDVSQIIIFDGLAVFPFSWWQFRQHRQNKKAKIIKSQIVIPGKEEEQFSLTESTTSNSTSIRASTDVSSTKSKRRKYRFHLPLFLLWFFFILWTATEGRFL